MRPGAEPVEAELPFAVRHARPLLQRCTQPEGAVAGVSVSARPGSGSDSCHGDRPCFPRPLLAMLHTPPSSNFAVRFVLYWQVGSCDTDCRNAPASLPHSVRLDHAPRARNATGELGRDRSLAAGKLAVLRCPILVVSCPVLGLSEHVLRCRRHARLITHQRRNRGRYPTSDGGIVFVVALKPQGG